MKILEKSARIAFELFPSAYESRDTASVHFTFIFLRNKLLSTGINYKGQDSNVRRLAQKNRIKEWEEWPTVHSEMDAISKLIGKCKVGPNLKLVNIRISKNGKFRNSRPCSRCSTILKSFGVNKIWFTNSLGEFCSD